MQHLAKLSPEAFNHYLRTRGVDHSKFHAIVHSARGMGILRHHHAGQANMAAMVLHLEKHAVGDLAKTVDHVHSSLTGN